MAQCHICLQTYATRAIFFSTTGLVQGKGCKRNRTLTQHASHGEIRDMDVDILRGCACHRKLRRLREQAAACQAHESSLLLRSCAKWISKTESEVQFVDSYGTSAIPLPPPPPTWKGVATPNLKAIFLLKLLTLITCFYSCAIRGLPLRSGHKATNAETQC